MSKVQISSEQEASQFALATPFLRKIINSISDGITICDRHGKIIFQNDVDIELVGMNFVNYYADEIVAKGLTSDSITMKVLKSKETATILQTFMNGRTMLVTGKPIFDENGDLQFVVAVTRDVTQLKRQEQEIEKLETQNEKFKNKLKALQSKKLDTGSLIAVSPAMVRVVKRVIRIAEVDSTVLIEGESGVGKEEVTKLIHQHSRRRDKKFLTINCSAIPETLLESELFGYEAGSFTGAMKGGKPGLFEIASGGTIFLDEIGEMPLHLQAKLLRVLQESEVQRIGSSKTIPIDVRIIAATNRRLIDMVQHGEFREDLYYRLNIIPIRIPPLRERKEDIVPLVNYFLGAIKDKYGIHRNIEGDALKALQNYDWPGNVRQLKNIIERVCLLAAQPEITVKAVLRELDSHQIARTRKPLQSPVPCDDVCHDNRIESLEFQGTLKEKVAAFEKMVIKKALSEHPSIRKAAEALGCDQSTLVRKIQRYELKRSLQYKD